MFEHFLADFRYGFRRLRQNLLFTLTAAASLAVGIGATTAIFSLGNSLLLRPIPGVQDVARVVDVGRTQEGKGFDTVSLLNYIDLRDRNKSFEGIYAYEVESSPMSLGDAAAAERIYGTVVSGNYFDVLGVRPRAGRVLHAMDDRAGAAPVAVISDGLWRRRFHADPNLPGKTITLNGQVVTVVGVAKEGFSGTTVIREDIWLPISALTTALPRMGADTLHRRSGAWLMMGGRLRDGVSIAQANSELSVLGAELEREYPKENRGKNYRAAALARFPGRASVVAAFIALLMTIGGLILLIACVNLVSMLLARAAQREHELAVRLAIGANRRRLLQQLMTETLMLFVMGGAAGLLLAEWMLRTLLLVIPKLPVPIEVEPTTDWRVVSFAFVLTMVVGILSGLVPALHSSSGKLVGSLKSTAGNEAPSEMRLRDAFVVSQIVLSIVLVIVGGLFVRAIGHAANVDPGFDQSNVDVASLDLSLGRYDDKTGPAMLSRLIDRVAALPNVVSVSAAADLPLDGDQLGLGPITVPGVASPKGSDGWEADANIVEPGVLKTLRIPLLQGRDFTAEDTDTSEPVAIINQVFAQRVWPGQSAVGKHLEMESGPGDSRRVVTVVGVAANARFISLNDAVEPYIYVPLTQSYRSRMSLVVRSRDGATTIPHIRSILREINPNLPLTEAMPLSDTTAIELVPQKLAAALAGSLGIVGLLMAAIGIYGVTAHSVSRRRRELAIRMALGSDRNQAVRFVLRHMIRLAAMGICIGLVVAAVGSRLLQSLLFGLKGLDPVTFGVAVLLFGTVTAIASYLPARAVTEIDPLVALRIE